MKPRHLTWITALGVLLIGLVAAPAKAQELEPRAYTNVPVGLNFLIGAYAHSEGGLSTDPSLPVEDAKLKIDSAILGYARSLNLWGNSGKVDVILPYSDLSGTALVAGEIKERDARGFGDPRLRLSINFFGAPALSPQEFITYRQNLVIGASLQVSAPGSQYDSSRVINLATNRWSVKPDIGLSKTLGAFMFDLTAGATFYSDNDNYYGGKRLEKDPIYSVQSNLSYNFGRGIWGAIGATYYDGGRTTVDGVRNDDAIGSSRIGAILSFPVNRQHSIKFNASRGVTTRVGTSFDTVGIAWQYRWGAGI